MLRRYAKAKEEEENRLLTKKYMRQKSRKNSKILKPKQNKFAKPPLTKIQVKIIMYPPRSLASLKHQKRGFLFEESRSKDLLLDVPLLLLREV
jgi:hypothetical protein